MNEDGAETPGESVDEARESRTLWRLVALAIVGFYFAPLVLAIPLLDPDEGIHAAIAQEMVERGDYVTPRLQGQAFLDKPILYFWLQAASLRAFGFHEFAVRLPGVACAVAGALTTGLLARRIWGGLAAPIAVLVHLTMVAPLALAQAAVHDVALVPLANLALFSWLTALETPWRGRAFAWFAAGGALLGLAILTKGLVGPALVGLAFTVYVILARRTSWFVVGSVAVASLLGLIVAAPWYGAMSVENPGYLHYFFVERHLQGFATRTQRHGGRPWWYYLPILAGGALPWTLDWASLAVRRWKTPWRGPAGAIARPWWLLAGWICVDTAFLSTAGSKMWTYCLPLFPALAVASAPLWVEAWRRRPAVEPVWYRASVAAISTVVGIGLLPIAMRVTARHFGVTFSPSIRLVGVGVALTLPAMRLLWATGRGRLGLACFLVSGAAHAWFILGLIVPHVATNTTARELAEHWNARGELPARVVVIDERPGSLLFYLKPELRRELRDGRIEAIYRQILAAEPARANGATVVVSNRTWPKLDADSPFRAEGYEAVGRFRLYRVANANVSSD